MKRRDFLRASAAGAAAAAATDTLARVPGQAAEASLPPYVGAGSNTAILPFPLQDVRLGAGLFLEKRDRMLNFARQYDHRRFLVLFNNQAGRPNPPGVTPPGGWEDGGLLSGHYAGHYLTLLAQSHASTGEQVFQDKLDFMVAELAACQEAITARMESGGGGGGPSTPPPIGRVAGRFGNALRLNGPSTANHVRLPQEVGAQLSDFTIAAWVNPAATTQWSRIFDFGTGTAANMFLTVNAGSGPRFAITTSGSQGEQRINVPGQLPLNQWTHVAVTLSAGTGTVYLNGQVAANNTGITLTPAQIGPGNNWVGRSQYNDPALNAAVDEFHVFNRALTPAEVASLLESPEGTTGGGNIAWYRFDEQGGTAATDSSGNNRGAGIVPVQSGGAAGWIPTHPGYLGAYPEDAVLRLGPPRFAVYGGNPDTNTWAPWYTQHKIMRGLLDAYTLTGNQLAFDVVVKMADWAHLALTLGDMNHPDYPGPITRDDLNYMWDLYIGGEFGGANEVFPEIYALTGDEKHLRTAKLFDNRESLFDACVRNRDILVTTAQTRPGRRRPAVLHANTHVPQFTGYLRIFEQTGEADYHLAAANFYRMIIPERMYAHGGTGSQFLPLTPGAAGNNNSELFQPRRDIARNLLGGQYVSGTQTVTITGTGAESCTTYNLLKLARNLFFHDPDPSYMDYYERGLTNHILGSRQDANSATSPQVTYFLPVFAGADRGYGNTGTCCGGTGLENHTKHQETVYFRSADGSTLWVNLYLASTLSWPERGLTIEQATDFPRSESSTLTFTGASGPLTLKLRVPAWASHGYRIKINGLDQEADAIPGSYLTLHRDWHTGDTVEIAMPFPLRVERALDDPSVQSLFHGPVLLPVLGAPIGSPPDRRFVRLSLYRHLKLDGDLSRAATPTGQPSHFTIGTHTVRPLYLGDTQPQHCYFKRDEPEVVFGSITAGVPNDATPDDQGFTVLDRIWDAAPFANHGLFVRRVEEVTAQWLSTGRHTRAQRQAILTAAARAEQELRP
ncbi:beta-L-arabinofuranosidase domain-containing protein [Allorhizocola rhizosphaerae]|uniref:beta-L-arabinofuranosidase domain-containing protein n=1 Tax=Allorhizocola rhizosphaerae TaxID=1872709 RepID=UPI000E3DC754|nr:beta-L-arabinofuranosidase domain-containing protein [Allorhizocola rhizosphaerae]